LNLGSNSPERLLAFHDSFLLLAGICALALLAAWKLDQPETHQRK
jgi:hypothetical protein